MRIIHWKYRYHYQFTTPRDLGEIQLFRKFQIFADGGPRRKTEKFWQVEKKIGDLHELDILRKKFYFKTNFKLKMANIFFFKIFRKFENIFLKIA